MQRNSLIHKIKRNGSPNSQRCATGVCGGWKMMRGATKGRGGERKKAPPLSKWSDITKEKDPVRPGLFIICHVPFKSSMHAELHIPVVIRGFDPSRNESHMTLCQKSWYVTPNLLINAHFIIPWPPGLCSQGGFDPFLRLKKNQKCFTFEHFGTESVLRFLHWRDSAAARATWKFRAVRWGQIWPKLTAINHH